MNELLSICSMAISHGAASLNFVQHQQQKQEGMPR